jgi:hypothetical protein
MADESVRERVLRAVEAQLRGIRKDAGYRLDMQTVERDRTTPLQLDSGEFPCVFVFEGPQTVSDAGTHTRAKHLQLVLQGWVKTGDGDLSVVVNQLAADIEQAMDADPTLGGLADNVTYQDDEALFGLGESLAGIHMNYAVHYRTRRGDPSQAA